MYLKTQPLFSSGSIFFHLLFRHGKYGGLVHFHIVDTHAAEYGKRFHKVLVVWGERQVVELKKYDSNF